ncbi:MAG TPA: metal-dependent hydrolase [Candidatus Acidoferrales bacterium]|nr:metal-dependent hydrolase [Candidatus Acidoferrales bacterium]
MDPVTHALSGAVLARAVLPNTANPQSDRVARATLVLGAIFPDIDVFANPFDPDHFGTIRIHRGVTHSLVCLPVWAILFALLAAWYCRRRGIAAPRRPMLGLLFGTGIALHILFDCITSFGTMVWSPISWTRVEWDWTFIIDLSLTGVLLFFLLISWVAGEGKQRTRRAVFMLLLMGVLVGLYSLASSALRQPAPGWVLAAVLAISAVPLVVALAGRGFPLSPRAWSCIGLLATAFYLGADAWAHARAMDRVREYASAAQLVVTDEAAIPMPPNLDHWQGFARASGTVHQWAISLARPSAAPLTASVVPSWSGAPCPPILWTIPQVRAWLHFARVPVVVCASARDGYTAAFSDLRFERPPLAREPRGARGHPISFTWRVTFSPSGRVLSEGWVTD